MEFVVDQVQGVADRQHVLRQQERLTRRVRGRRIGDQVAHLLLGRVRQGFAPAAVFVQVALGLQEQPHQHQAHVQIGRQ